MVEPSDYKIYVLAVSSKADQKVMARVALNALFAPDRYPVDLSEIALLRSDHKLMTRAFLARCALEPSHYLSWSQGRCWRLIALLEDEKKPACAP